MRSVLILLVPNHIHHSDHSPKIRYYCLLLQPQLNTCGSSYSDYKYCTFPLTTTSTLHPPTSNNNMHRFLHKPGDPSRIYPAMTFVPTQQYDPQNTEEKTVKILMLDGGEMYTEEDVLRELQRFLDDSDARRHEAKEKERQWLLSRVHEHESAWEMLHRITYKTLSFPRDMPFPILHPATSREVQVKKEEVEDFLFHPAHTREREQDEPEEYYKREVLRGGLSRVNKEKARWNEDRVASIVGRFLLNDQVNALQSVECMKRILREIESELREELSKYE